MQKVAQFVHWDEDVFVYDSISSFISDLSNLKDWLRSPNLNESQEKWDERWRGTNTYKEAIDLQYGYWIWIKKLKFAKKNSIVFKEYNDISGWRVDIWEYLVWSPTSMIDSLPTGWKKKLRILFNIWANCWTSWEALQKRSSILFSIAQSLDKTYQLQMYASYFWMNYRENKKMWCVICIKDFGQRFIKNNIAFTFHTAFFRRIMFKFMENRKYNTQWYWRSCWIEQFPHLQKDRHIDVYVPWIEDVWNDILEKYIMDKIQQIVDWKQEKQEKKTQKNPWDDPLSSEYIPF